MLETQTLDQFARFLHQDFAIHLDSGAVGLTLIEANPLGSAGGNGAGRKPFSLIFRGPSAPVLPQAIYRLEQEEMGAVEIFLVPVGPASEGMRYEVVFT
jgi:hypothetical protein